MGKRSNRGKAGAGSSIAAREPHVAQQIPPLAPTPTGSPSVSPALTLAAYRPFAFVMSTRQVTANVISVLSMLGALAFVLDCFVRLIREEAS